MRSLSGILSAALSAPVTRPAVLVQADFATVQRWTSGAARDWDGHSWTAPGMRVEDLAVGTLELTGTLVLANADGSAGTLVLDEGVKDRPFTLWGYDAAAPTEVVWLGAAVGARAQVDPRQVRISLRHRSEYTVSPRTYVGVGAGFNQMLAAGTVLRINGVDVRLDRRS
jgi:hypothetical protein